MRNTLGKGLDALFFDNETENSQSLAVNEIRLSDIEPNRNQPRKKFDEDKIEELCESIKQHGVITPLVLVAKENNRYMIVAGERRWRAARKAGLESVPAVVKELDEQQIAQIALIENLQRQDLSVVEEAIGYKELIEKYSLTQEQVAKSVSKSRVSITNAIRLLKLPQEILQMLEEKTLSEGHARAILAIDDAQRQIEVAKKAVKKGLTVRDVEKLAKNKEKPEENAVMTELTMAIYQDMQSQLTKALGRKVVITAGKTKGKIELEYYGDDDLSALYEKLTNG